MPQYTGSIKKLPHGGESKNKTARMIGVTRANSLPGGMPGAKMSRASIPFPPQLSKEFAVMSTNGKVHARKARTKPRKAEATLTTSAATAPPNPAPTKAQATSEANTFAHVQPGLMVYSSSWTGPCLVMRRGPDPDMVTLLTSHGLMTDNLSSIDEIPTDGSVLTRMAPQIAALFEFHDETKPFADTETNGDVTIRPGLVFMDDENGFGAGVVVNVAGNTVYVIHADGDACSYSLDEIRRRVANDGQSVGDIFDTFADHIASLFDLHPATAPFAPKKRYRDIPICPTPAGSAFIDKLLEFARLSSDDDWSADALIDGLGEEIEQAKQGGELLRGLWGILDATGTPCSSFDPKVILDRIRADYAELAAFRKHEGRKPLANQ